MLEEIEARGAQAARNGWSLLDCPFLRANEMPGHTGEAIADWRQKVEAWETGWQKEVNGWKLATSTIGSPTAERIH